MKTAYIKAEEVERNWYVVDATDKVLGRLASEVAKILRGKHKPTYQPNVDTGDYVIVINADKIRLTGMKENTKEYFMFRKHIGHSSTIPFKVLKEKHPERVIERAVKGMLPHNSLGRRMCRKLHVYAGPDHKHQAQKPEVFDV